MPRESKIAHRFSIYKIRDVVRCTLRLEGLGYTEIGCREPEYKLYIHHKDSVPRWTAAIKSLAVNPNEVVGDTSITSYVVLVTLDDDVYAFTGGSGYFAIQSAIEPDFGINVISKVIEPDRIKYIKQKPLSGRTVQEDRVYKDYYNYEFDLTNWGKISKEILGEIDNLDLNGIFGIELSGRYRIRLQGKSSFSITRSLSMAQLRHVLTRLHAIESQENKFNIYKGFSEVADKETKNALNMKLIEELGTQYGFFLESREEFVETNIFLSYIDAREYLFSDSYTLLLRGHNARKLDNIGLKDVFEYLSDCGIDTFADSQLNDLTISGHDADEGEKISDRLKEFLAAEITHEHTVHCFIDGRWYRINDAFIEQTNARLDEVLKSALVSGYSLPDWSYLEGNLETEDQYIPRVCGMDGFVQMHRDHIVIKGKDRAEVCDIVDMRTTEPCFVFVKHGFGTKLRELFAQACNSTELFLRDNAFQSKATQKIGLKKGEDFNVAKPAIIMAFADKIGGRQDVPLSNRLTTVVKLDLSRAMEFLESMGVSRVYAYEIPQEVPE